MSVEAVIPAAAAVAVSLAGFLYARFTTARFDRERQMKRDVEVAAGDGPHMTVDLADLEKALSSEGVNAGRLSDVLRDARHRKIELPVSIGQR